jgi:hypothetical protein
MTATKISVSGPRFESEASRIRNRNDNHSTATFGRVLGRIWYTTACLQFPFYILLSGSLFHATRRLQKGSPACEGTSGLGENIFVLIKIIKLLF